LSEIASQSPDAPLTVLAHSLGSITWMHLAAERAPNGTRLADRVLLVAPPYVISQIPPIDVPPTVTAFFPPPTDPAAMAAIARETVLIASDTDDYATFDQSSGYAQLLGVPIHKLLGAGHISPYYGYGEWPWALGVVSGPRRPPAAAPLSSVFLFSRCKGAMPLLGEETSPLRERIPFCRGEVSSP